MWFSSAIPQNLLLSVSNMNKNVLIQDKPIVVCHISITIQEICSTSAKSASKCLKSLHYSKTANACYICYISNLEHKWNFLVIYSLCYNNKTKSLLWSKYNINKTHLINGFNNKDNNIKCIYVSLKVSSNTSYKNKV